MTGFLDTPGGAGGGPDPGVESFWQAVTGWGLSARRGGGAFATLLPGDGDACLRVQVVGDSPARAHLDLHVDDVAAAAAEVAALGATLVAAEDGLVVSRSPAGIVFCLVRWGGERRRPAPVRWPGGQSSVVDQLCLDLPGAVHDREAGFWAAVTGWERRSSDLPEFSWLERPAGLGLRLLLQRTGGEVAGVHVDLACDDVDAEVERHVGWGAVVVRRVPGDWTTLRDPAGREYCVTGRSPLPA
ncbi:VOC family protein [Actinoplanes sp. NEAU-A12]|uniref:VOC family protein n=1 Tax=Actinoplanes sandaracinus TaxID=3045177 RepID=A0ABT6WZA9_9ACTN|nr:VOC family protein [Actinoplanes sandaracinus]